MEDTKKYFRQNLYDLKEDKKIVKSIFEKIDFSRSHKDHRHFLK